MDVWISISIPYTWEYWTPGSLLRAFYRTGCWKRCEGPWTHSRHQYFFKIGMSSSFDFRNHVRIFSDSLVLIMTYFRGSCFVSYPFWRYFEGLGTRDDGRCKTSWAHPKTEVGKARFGNGTRYIKHPLDYVMYQIFSAALLWMMCPVWPSNNRPITSPLCVDIPRVESAFV